MKQYLSLKEIKSTAKKISDRANSFYSSISEDEALMRVSRSEQVIRKFYEGKIATTKLQKAAVLYGMFELRVNTETMKVEIPAEVLNILK